MATHAATHAATHDLKTPTRNTQPVVIEENSLLMKALSYVPLIGIIPSVVQERSLDNKIFNTQDPTRVVELINVKNQYKIANAVRCLVSAALIIAGIISGILSGPLAFGSIGSPLLFGTISTILLTGAAGLNIYKICQNNASISYSTSSK